MKTRNQKLFERENLSPIGESIVGKVENANYQHFLFFVQSYLPGSLKPKGCLVKGKFPEELRRQYRKNLSSILFFFFCPSEKHVHGPQPSMRSAIWPCTSGC